MAEFKFAIGEPVYNRQGIQDCLTGAAIGQLGFPSTFVVNVRLCDECSGGTQLYYLCSREGQTLKFSEAELVKQTEWDVEELFARWEVGYVRRAAIEKKVKPAAAMSGDSND